MQSIIPIENIKEYNSTRNFFWRKKLCYAPFNSLRFSLSGNIYFCCYNRFHSLGKYPETSITEAWNGKKANELREKIPKNDLSLGCHSCYSKLINKNYYSSGSKIYDGFKVRNKWPSLMDFEISNQCNLECIMCNGENSSLIRKNREKGLPYSMVYNEGFLEELKEYIPYLQEARFVGGEPFIIDYYYKIWELISSLNKKIKISILTNGTVLNDRILQFYKNNNVHVSFSIDSINNITYNSIRINGDYTIVKNNFETIYSLSKKLKRELTVNICPIRKNMWEIPEMINHYSALNIPIVLHVAVYPSCEVISTLTSEELKKYYDFLLKSQISGKGFIHRNNQLALKSFTNQVNIWQINSSNIKNDNTIGIEELKSELTKKIQKYLTDVVKDENNRLEKYIYLINNIITNIDNEETKKIALRNLISINTGYIISELETSSYEKLKERIFALGN